MCGGGSARYRTWEKERSGLDELTAQLGQRGGEQPGDVHLGDAELGGDLRLRHLVEEPHRQDPAFAVGQTGEQRLDRLAVVDRLDARVIVTERVGDAEVAVG